MPEKIVVYCDESCHLENDGIRPMVLGCIWAPRTDVKRLTSSIKDIKRRHNANGELKWIKASKIKTEFYRELVEWFFAESPLHFRAVVIPDKQLLDHNTFNEGSHDLFYYKSQFSLLNKILSPTNCYSIYLDIKDTRSKFRVNKLKEVLLTNKFDFTESMIDHVQQIRSHESELMQLADLFIGAIGYKHRELETNFAKISIISLIEEKIGRSLRDSTPLTEQKFNMFVWRARRCQ